MSVSVAYTITWRTGFWYLATNGPGHVSPHRNLRTLLREIGIDGMIVLLSLSQGLVILKLG